MNIIKRTTALLNTNQNLKKILLVWTFLLLNACAYSVHEVQVSDYTPYTPMNKAGSEVIKSQGDQFVIMGFTQETQYVNSAYKQLQEKCPKGEITGIVTRFWTDLGFFSWTNKVSMTGLCNKI